MSDTTRLTVVITRCHQQLDELFILHQESVLLGKFDDAIKLFNAFKKLHHLHMGFEDDILIPKLGTLDDRGRWPASLYAHEHSKVQELMDKTEKKLRTLSQIRLADNHSGRIIINFIEHEKTFKGLCAHHQEREESGLLPELDKYTESQWRRSIILPFLKKWDDGLTNTPAADIYSGS